MRNRNILTVQSLIRCLDVESLRNPDVIANLVRVFGLMPWGPSPSGPERLFITKEGACIGQTPEQIAKALVYLSQFKINSFCEIGVCYGANFLFCSEYLRRFNPEIECWGVDPTNYLDDEIREIIDHETFMTHKSLTSKQIVGKKFDFVFIDGDHTMPWIVQDWQNLGQHAKICGFHDLQDPLWPDVKAFWKGLNGKGKVKVEFLDDLSDCSTHGVGLIHQKGIE